MRANLAFEYLRSCRLVIKITACVLIFLCMLSGGGYAAGVPFSTTYTTTGPIDYVTTGASFRENAGNDGDANNPDKQTCRLNQSTLVSDGFREASNAVSPIRTAAQQVPAGATITKAILYWAASSGESGYGSPIVDDTVSFGVSGGTLQTVTANSTWNGSVSETYNGDFIEYYQMGAWADVTSIVAANPNAQFQMDGLTIFTGSDQFGGPNLSYTCSFSTVSGNWALYIIYSQPNLSNKSIKLSHGLQFVGAAGILNGAVNTYSQSISNLRVPDADVGTQKVAKTSVYLVEGDQVVSPPATGGDKFAIGTDLDAAFEVSNGANPTTDFFNSSITVGDASGGAATGYTALGTGGTTAVPGVVGGLDLDTINISNNVSVGVTSITGTIDSNAGELLMLYNMTLMATSTTADVQIVKTNKVATGPYYGGTNHTYQIVVSNNGPDEAYKVVVSDSLPAGVTYVSSTGGGIYNSGAGTVTWPTISRLDSGQSQTFEVTVKLPNISTTLNNTASVSSGSYDSNASNNISIESTVVTPSVDLAVTKTGPAYVQPEQNISYSLRVWNNQGTDSAAVITDTVPAALTGVSWTCVASGSASCGSASGTGNNISLTANLPADTGSTATADTNYVTITVLGIAPNTSNLESTASVREWTNTAIVATSTGLVDGVAGNNSASVDTKTVYTKLLKQVRNITTGTAFGPSAEGLPQEVLEYCITYSNYGGTTLSDFVVSDSVPANLVVDLNAYDSQEPSPVTGFGIKVGAATFYTSAAGDDIGTLTNTGGAFGAGALTLNVGSFTSGASDTVCFRAGIQ